MHRSSNGRGLAHQFQSAKQLRVRGYDEPLLHHRDGPQTHGEIEPPVREKTAGDRDSDKVTNRHALPNRKMIQNLVWATSYISRKKNPTSGLTEGFRDTRVP